MLAVGQKTRLVSGINVPRKWLLPDKDTFKYYQKRRGMADSTLYEEQSKNEAGTIESSYIQIFILVKVLEFQNHCQCHQRDQNDRPEISCSSRVSCFL